jgi:hypothetical protein
LTAAIGNASSATLTRRAPSSHLGRDRMRSFAKFGFCIARFVTGGGSAYSFAQGVEKRRSF